METSTRELRQLAKTLNLLEIEEDDIRYDVFSMIYEMLFDNIELRVKQNKLNTRILGQSQLTLDKTVHTYVNAFNPPQGVDIEVHKFSKDLIEQHRGQHKTYGELGESQDKEAIMSDFTEEEEDFEKAGDMLKCEATNSKSVIKSNDISKGSKTSKRSKHSK